MRAARRDQITGYVLLVFAAAWIMAVWQTVPPGAPGTVGPRAFPLGLGVALGGLALLLLAGSYWKSASASTDDSGKSDEIEAAPAGWLDLGMVLSTFLVIVAYGFLMQRAGFVLSTLVIVSVMMVVVLKIRNPVTVVGMAAGLAFGCWLVFGKILGAYLPPGTWLSLL